MQQQRDTPDAGIAVVVIGGANLDHKSGTFARPILGTSNPGSSRSSVGGVARNIAENLARMDVSVALITAVGRDAEGDRIIQATGKTGVALGQSFRTSRPTGSYTAILSESGDLVLAVSAMESVEDLSPAAIDAASDVISRARVVVLDCNVLPATLLRAATIAAEHGIPIVLDPVSVPKAGRAAALLAAGIRIHTFTPNLDELRALTARPGATEADTIAAAGSLNAVGVENVWVRQGADGSLLSCATGGPPRTHHIPACAATLVDATGAGDSMLAGYVAALLDGHDPVTAVRRGAAAAAITIESELTVSPAMSAQAVAARASRQGGPNEREP